MKIEFSELDTAVNGSVTTEFDASYEAARLLFNTRIRSRPLAICRCADASDVVRAVRFARKAGLPVGIRGGGHNPGGAALVEGGLVIDVGAIEHVRLNDDAPTPSVTVGPGAGWRDIDRVTYERHTIPGDNGVAHGYATPSGDCPTVSNAGFSLGGGYGPLTRRFGLGCDQIVAAEVVDARGEVLRVDDDQHPDLFWALRGAGGAGLGVVTELTYRLHPLPKSLLCGMISWPLDQAEDIFRAYRDLYADRVDDRLALSLLLSTMPYPDGEPVITMYGLYIGSPDEGEQALAPIRTLGKPLDDSFGRMSYTAFMGELGAKIVYGLQAKWQGGYFGPTGFDDAAFEVMVKYVRAAPSAYSMVRFDLLGGGAVSRIADHATAFSHRNALHNVSIIALWHPGAPTDLNLAWIDEFMSELKPALSGQVYQNYADENLTNWAKAYYGEHYPRLQQIKKRYDPDDLFHHIQSVRLP
ncbi:MAG: FAD-binding oxidoreductase [Frankiales bacterium]|nr:FAD-binding oxidoreductase [Frankiales bacterium]